MNSSHRPYMLDTNVFNDLLDEKISFVSLVGRRLLIIGVQKDELRRTSGCVRRTKLLDKLEVVNPMLIPASSFAFDIEGAGFEQACWNDGTGNFERMRDRLHELDAQQKKPNRPLNQERDILIAETAIKNNAILVSGDSNLRQVVSEFGGCAMDRVQFESESIYGCS